MKARYSRLSADNLFCFSAPPNREYMCTNRSICALNLSQVLPFSLGATKLARTKVGAACASPLKCAWRFPLSLFSQGTGVNSNRVKALVHSYPPMTRDATTTASNNSFTILLSNSSAPGLRRARISNRRDLCQELSRGIVLRCDVDGTVSCSSPLRFFENRVSHSMPVARAAHADSKLIDWFSKL